MNELDEVRAWDPGSPPLDDAARNRARARLLAAVHEETAPPAPRPLYRRFARVAVTGLAAAAVVAGLVIAVDDGSGKDGRDAARPAAGVPPMTNVSAQTVLNGAAAWERKNGRSAGAPRDDQFIYTKEIIKETEQGTGRNKRYVDENWRSVDDSQRSWVMEIGRGWWAEPSEENESSWPPQDWSRLKKLPTEPDKLILSVSDWFGGGEKGRTVADITDDEWPHIEFALAGLLKLVPVMPEGLRPAAYEALGRVPGVEVVPDQKDAKGRTGVAIIYNDPTRKGKGTGFGTYFIFNPRTYEFLGCRDIRTTGNGKSLRTYTQLSYLDSWAITDKAKQHP